MRLLYVTSDSLPARIIRGIDGGEASHVGIESPLRPGEVIDSTWLHGGVTDWQDDRRWYCSELAICACLQGGMALAGRRAELGVRLSMEIAHAWALGRAVTINPSRYLPT